MERPECYEFGMEFMGDPEETEIRKYVEWLEKRIAQLEAAQQAGAVDTPSALCPKCGLPLVAGLGCIDCD